MAALELPEPTMEVPLPQPRDGKIQAKTVGNHPYYSKQTNTDHTETGTTNKEGDLVHGVSEVIRWPGLQA